MEEALAKSIFFVGMGSNDYLNNYLMPNYNTKNQYNPQEYATLLTQQYNQQLIVRILFLLSHSIFFSCNLFSHFHLLNKIAEIIQSWSKKICDWWSRTNGVYSKYSCTKPKWCMFRGSESTCSSIP